MAWNVPSMRLSASSISCTSSVCMAVGEYVAGGMTHTCTEYGRTKYLG